MFQAWGFSSRIVARQSEKSEGFSRKKPKIIVLFGMFFLLPLLFIPFMAFMFFPLSSGNSKIFFHRFHFSLLIFVLFPVAFYSQLPDGDTVTFYILMFTCIIFQRVFDGISGEMLGPFTGLARSGCPSCHDCPLHTTFHTVS